MVSCESALGGRYLGTYSTRGIITILAHLSLVVLRIFMISLSLSLSIPEQHNLCVYLYTYMYAVHLADPSRMHKQNW